MLELALLLNGVSSCRNSLTFKGGKSVVYFSLATSYEPICSPPGATSGDVGCLRSLIGPWGDPYTSLFNLLTFTIE